MCKILFILAEADDSYFTHLNKHFLTNFIVTTNIHIFKIYQE